jgi:hypothetical protein
LIRNERGPENPTAAGKAGPGRICGSRIDLALYTVIPIWYGCNNNCVICMLEPVKGKLRAVDFDLFKKLVIDVAASGACRRLILSGGGRLRPLPTSKDTSGSRPVSAASIQYRYRPTAEGSAMPVTPAG